MVGCEVPDPAVVAAVGVGGGGRGGGGGPLVPAGAIQALTEASAPPAGCIRPTDSMAAVRPHLGGQIVEGDMSHGQARSRRRSISPPGVSLPSYKRLSFACPRLSARRTADVLQGVYPYNIHVYAGGGGYAKTARTIVVRAVSGVEEPHMPAQKGLGAFQIGLWGSSRDGRRFRGRAAAPGGAVGVIRQQFDPLGVPEGGV